jgi:hypothetical protein
MTKHRGSWLRMAAATPPKAPCDETRRNALSSRRMAPDTEGDVRLSEKGRGDREDEHPRKSANHGADRLPAGRLRRGFGYNRRRLRKRNSFMRHLVLATLIAGSMWAQIGPVYRAHIPEAVGTGLS